MLEEAQTKSYYGWVTEFTDEKYNPRMGFVRQNNVIRHNPGGYFVLRPKKLPWIRRWDPGAFFNYNHDANDPRRIQLASIYLFLFTPGLKTIASWKFHLPQHGKTSILPFPH